MYVTRTFEYAFTLYASEHNMFYMFYFVSIYSQSGLSLIYLHTNYVCYTGLLKMIVGF